MQIRTRLTLQFIAAVAGILLLALGFVWARFRQMTESGFYNDLRTRAVLTAEAALRNEAALLPVVEYVEDGDETGTPSLDSLPYQNNVVIYNAALQKVFTLDERSLPIAPSVLVELQGAVEERHFQHGPYQALGLRKASPSGALYLIVTEAVFDDSGLKRLRNILIITLLAGVAVVALVGWLLAGQALSPVARLVRQVEAIRATDLNARLAVVRQHDELGRLATAFNLLLDRVQAAFQAQRAFISNVSHELRNPLASIIAQIEVALHRERSPDDYRKTLASTLDDSRELAESSSKLLALARVESEGASLPMELLRLDELVLQTEAALTRQHPHYRVVFELENVPDDEEALFTNGNEALLRLALLNLLDNACKFSPDHRVDVRLTFASAPEGQHLLEISDRGPGIAPADLERIFEPFYRANPTRQLKGSGIGLSLVRRILDLHHIDCEVVSRVGEGTTFRLFLPFRSCLS